MKFWVVGCAPILLLAFAIGCDTAADGDQPTTATGAMMPAEPGAGGSETDDAPAGAEERCDALTGACADEGVCDAYPCGGRTARFNHFGCPRHGCSSDDECPAGEACFPLVYGTTCEPSATTCTEVDGSCRCAGAPDCDGTLDAHCLPTEFYPPAEYCDVGTWTCDELPGWLEALQRAEASHREGGSATIADAIAGCLDRARTSQEAC